jgi:hypothetical protein
MVTVVRFVGQRNDDGTVPEDGEAVGRGLSIVSVAQVELESVGMIGVGREGLVERARVGRAVGRGGPRWGGFENKLTGIAVPEHRDSNLHYHVAVMVPELDRLPRLLSQAGQLFRKVAPAGKIDTRLIETPWGRARLASYVAKKAFEQEIIERLASARLAVSLAGSPLAQQASERLRKSKSHPIHPVLGPGSMRCVR